MASELATSRRRVRSVAPCRRHDMWNDSATHEKSRSSSATGRPGGGTRLVRAGHLARELGMGTLWVTCRNAGIGAAPTR